MNKRESSPAAGALADLVATSERVAATSARKEKVALLAAYLEGLRGREVALAVSYLSGTLPQGKVGIGYAALQKANAATAETSTLTLADIDSAFGAIASTSGAGSAGAKVEQLHDLLSRATREEARFLCRLLIGELRQGAQEGVMTDAIARAARVPQARVRRAVMLAGEQAAVAEAALTDGAAGLECFQVRLFRPIMPMLAQTAEDVGEALERLGEAALEHKLDGARIQIHRAGSDVAVFTRQLNDITASVPEVVKAALRLPVREIILDGEAIALKPDGRPHRFQTTMSRFGRRLDVDALRESLPLSAFFFDCLYIEGESLIDRTSAERFAALSESAPSELVIPRVATADPGAAEAFLESALAAGHEGIMAKALDATYEAGGRGRSWLKIKPAHTLDLVVLAAEWGHGRRRGRLSNLHLGARDPATGGFVMLGKTFKGLTDEMLEWQTKRLQQLEISRDAHTVYVRPELVVEIAFNNVQESPHYPGGLALRFARLKRYRADKSVSEADTIETVRAIHQRGS